MGFFSWECPCCKHSIRSEASTNKDSAWMSKAILVWSEGSTLRGEYDGYGRLTTRSGREVEGLGEGPDPSLYHQACWDLLKPGYRPSENAHDQGFFVGEYDPKRPRSVKDVQALAQAAEAAAVARQQEAMKSREDLRREYAVKGEPLPEWLRAQAN
jgi:hypothetical protein